MIQNVVTDTLYAYSGVAGLLTVSDLTLILPTKTGLRCYAELMLTSFSQGVDLDQRRVGSVVTRIVRGTVLGPSGIQFVDIPADPVNNSAYFKDCLAVDFRLGCHLSEAWVNCNVWYYKPPPTPAAPWKLGKVSKVALTAKPKVGGISGYSRRVVGPAELLPPLRQIERETLERAAAALEVRPSMLTLARSRGSARPRRSGGAGLAPRRRVV